MAANRRVKKGTTDTLTTYFYDGGESPIDKGAVTVSVASDTGTVLQSGSATNAAGTYTFALTTASTAAIDLLTVTWTSGTETQRTMVEVVGGFYFELADLRAMQDMANLTTFGTERLRAARQWIEDIIDVACNTSFVRRYAREQTNYYPDSELYRATSYGSMDAIRLIDSAWARSLLSISVGGVALSAPELALITVDPFNRVVLTTGFPWVTYGYAIIDIRYEAGFSDACPGDLRDAALQAARWRLISTDGVSGIPNRATSLTNEFGNVQLSTAGKNRPTGIPDVDAVINSYAQQTRIPGLA